MPRRRAAPRLYLDPGRHQWIIRDGASFIRTGCAEENRRGAEEQLAEYLAQKHRPARGPDPLIADILLVYANEHVPHTRTARDVSYMIADLSRWWGDRRLSDVTARSCRAYAATGRSRTTAGRNLQALRAAIRYWNREHGPIAYMPAIVLPPAPAPRERWLTRSEAARLLWAARRTPHLARMILLGIYTGSRMRTILHLEWGWIDMARGVMLRRAPGTQETKKRTPPVRLGRRILSHLKRWRRLDDLHCKHVCHYNGKVIDYPYVAWRRAIRDSGLGKGVTPHTLRHTRAAWLMQKGVDVWEAAGHLGMSPGILTRVYGKHSPDYQKRAAEV
jgi:integrase